MSQPPDSWSSPSGEPAPPPSYAPPPPSPYGPVPQGHQYGQPAWLQPGVVPLRPLALGEILDGSIKVIRRYPRPTLGLSAVIALVVTVLNVIAVLAVGNNGFTTRTSSAGGFQFDSGGAAASIGAALPTQLLGFIASLVLTGTLITVVGRAVQGQEAPMSVVWASVRPRLWALIGLALLTIVITVAPLVVGVLIAVVLAAAGGTGTLLIGIPLSMAGLVATVYLYVRLSIATPALVLEKAGVTQALRRSGVLVKGSWWRMFGILLVTGIIGSIVGAIIGVPLGIVSAVFFNDAGETPLRVAQQVGAGLASVLVSPFASGVRALLYVDRRMRAEGLDVALRAAVDPRTAG